MSLLRSHEMLSNLIISHSCLSLFCRILTQVKACYHITLAIPPKAGEGVRNYDYVMHLEILWDGYCLECDVITFTLGCGGFGVAEGIPLLEL